MLEPEPAAGVRNVVTGGLIQHLAQIGMAHFSINVDPRTLSTLPQQADPPAEIRPWRGRVFVNRVSGLDLLNRLTVQNSPSSAVIIHGLPGVGKTALVEHWAETARHRFPGGQIYIDFADPTRDAPMSVSAAAVHILRSLGADTSQLPASKSELAALVRSKTATAKPILFFFDNVSEAAPIHELLPSAAGSLIVATARRLILTDFPLEHMRALDVPHALQMLEAQGTAEPVTADLAAIQQIAQFCGGLPLILKVAGARLRRVSAAELAARWRDESRRLEAFKELGEQDVFALLDATFRELPPSAALLYQRLALFPGKDISAEFAALLTGQDPSQALDSLEILEDHQLLERFGGRRFQMPDVVKQHALGVPDTAVPGDTERALRAVVTRYRELAVRADHDIMGDRLRFTDLPKPGDRFEDSKMAFAWVERELPNLLAAQQLSFDRGWLEETWQFASALWAYFVNIRLFDLWQESLKLGIDAAKALGLKSQRTQLLCMASRMYLDLGRPGRAEQVMTEALHLAESEGNLRLLGTAWEFQGKLLERSDKDAALEAYDRSIQFNMDGEQSRGVAIAHLNKGRCLTDLGRPAEAIEALQEANRILDETGDQQRLIGQVLTEMGRAYMASNRDEEADRALSVAVELLDQGGWLHYQASAIDRLVSLRERRSPGPATELLRQRAADIRERF